MNLRFPILFASVLALTPLPVKSCMWDRDTLADEKKKSPKLAEVILGPAPAPADPAPLRARIQKLRAPVEDRTQRQQSVEDAAQELSQELSLVVRHQPKTSFKTESAFGLLKALSKAER